MAFQINPSLIICPHCRTSVPADAYFCPNCGKTLKTKPLSTSLTKQIVVYFVSLFIPPFGLWYAWKYLRQKDAKAKKIGAAAILLTVIAIIAAVLITDSIVNSLNQSLGQINGLMF